MKNEYSICDACYKCHWYYLNNDTENECFGSEKPCEEYIKSKLIEDVDKNE